LAWNHDDVRPNRSREELLGDVVRRGERLRRRRTVTGLGGCIALLVAVAGMAAVAGVGEEPSTQLAAGGPSTTASGAIFGPATGGTSLAVDAPTTTAVPDPTTATTATTVRPVVTTVATNTESTDPPAAAPPPEPATTIPEPSQPRCGPAQMQATLTFAKATYRPGEQVSGQAVLRNTSGAPCSYYSYTQSQQFRNAAGSPVGPGSALIADNFADTPFAPGQTLTATAEWDQQLCVTDPSCPQAPPGSYSATVSWSFDGPPVEVTTTFQLVP